MAGSFAAPKRPMSAGSGMHSHGGMSARGSPAPDPEVDFTYLPDKAMSGLSPGLSSTRTFGPPSVGGFKTFPRKTPAFVASATKMGTQGAHHRAIVNAMGTGPNLALGDTLQVVDTLAGFRGLAHAGVDGGKSGVWVSRDLWKSMRHQLEQKAIDAQLAADQHADVVRGYQKQLEGERTRFKELEESYRRVQGQLQEQSAERERLAMSLAHELEVKSEQLDKQKQEHEAQTEQLMRMLYERDGVEQRVDSLSKSLDDTAFRLKMENHRAQLAETKAKALEKELTYMKERHQNDMLRVEKLEAACREGVRSLNEQRLTVESYKAEMLAQRRPDDTINEELARLQTDNRRLVHMLEQTTECKKLMADLAAAKGVHYIPLSECLVDEGLVSHVYPSERDREVDQEHEAMQWVPRRAIEVTYAFLERLFPKVPVQPFMSLLLQLNKVWKDHEKDVVAHLKLQNEKELAKIRRQKHQTLPFEKVILEQRVCGLRKQVREAGKKGEKLEKEKDVAAKRGKEESKVLLEWGLSTIEQLSKQVTKTSRENQALRAHAHDVGLGDADVLRLAAEAAGGGGGGSGGGGGGGDDGGEALRWGPPAHPPPTAAQIQEAVGAGAGGRRRARTPTPTRAAGLPTPPRAGGSPSVPSVRSGPPSSGAGSPARHAWAP